LFLLRCLILNNNILGMYRLGNQAPMTLTLIYVVKDIILSDLQQVLTVARSLLKRY